MSRLVSRARMAQVAAVLLGLVVLGVVASTVVLDALVHTPGTGGPVVESLSIGAAAIPATLVGVLLAARRPRNPSRSCSGCFPTGGCRRAGGGVRLWSCSSSAWRSP